MAHLPPSDNAQQSEKTSDGTPKEPLIQVHASAQMAPRASTCCPVCGQPYAQGSLLITTDQQSPAVVTTETAKQTPAAAQQRVIRCAHCGTYSVGTPDTSPNGPEGQE
jgi:ribosomal protein S14